MVDGGVILGNRIIDVVFVSWFIAQGYKTLLFLIKERRINLRKFTESGGMPSSHTSSVASLVTGLGIIDGTDSPIFATALVFAIIVMYDAAGVRRAAGKQAGVLNRLIHSLGKKDNSIKLEEELKELIGHTPFEVLVGALLGFLVALIMLK